jgi:hypothetical protein
LQAWRRLTPSAANCTGPMPSVRRPANSSFTLADALTTKLRDLDVDLHLAHEPGLCSSMRGL